MPYRKLQDGQINFTGKSAEWLVDIEKWFSQDCGVGSKIPIGVYNYFLIINYGLLAKEKWSKGFFTKSKSKIIENMITKLPNGSIELKDFNEFLDYIAENLSRDDRINWSEQLRNKFIKNIIDGTEQMKSKQEPIVDKPVPLNGKPITIWQAIQKSNLKINNTDWKIAFLSNTGVSSSVTSQEFSSMDKALMLPEGQAGQWIVEYFKDSPIILPDEGRSYPFRRMLVTSNGASELPESNMRVKNMLNPLDLEFLKNIDRARELAISENIQPFDVISAYSEVRSNGECFWKFRFYNLQSGAIVNKICISSDGKYVCAW